MALLKKGIVSIQFVVELNSLPFIRLIIPTMNGSGSPCRSSHDHYRFQLFRLPLADTALRYLARHAEAGPTPADWRRDADNQ